VSRATDEVSRSSPGSRSDGERDAPSLPIVSGGDDAVGFDGGTSGGDGERSSGTSGGGEPGDDGEQEHSDP
jgi:hypothetical protein